MPMPRSEHVRECCDHALRLRWALNLLRDEVDRLPEVIDAHAVILGLVRSRFDALASDLAAYVNTLHAAELEGRV